MPSDVNNTNYLDIKVAFDLEQKNTYCEKREEETPWTLVTGDSYLYIGNNTINEYYFSSYGASFVKDGMFNDTAIKLLSNEKLELTDPFSSKIADFQFDVSKFNNQKAMLVLTSPDSEILKDSLTYLSSTEMLSKLNGDCAIIDRNGDIKTYKMKKETSKPSYEKLQALSGNAKALLIITGLFVVFAVSAAALYFFKNKKRK
ncbi:hypothetical protein [Clostridium sp. YIM B02555]|uniref:hypothetical protein n=1 Tax=Clostridium sp. YIM B02555 TaxID=2911968 RepID=UPI001EED1C1E|nr:hypothetical protein [Clostridium sp. YIM B02555]